MTKISENLIQLINELTITGFQSGPHWKKLDLDTELNKAKFTITSEINEYFHQITVEYKNVIKYITLNINISELFDKLTDSDETGRFTTIHKKIRFHSGNNHEPSHVTLIGSFQGEFFHIIFK